MRQASYRDAAVALLVISILLASLIDGYDGLLWRLSASTGTTLIGMTVLYLILIGVLFVRHKLGLMLTLVFSSLNFLGQLGNAAIGVRNPVFTHGFTAYVLGLAPVSDPSLCPYSCPPFQFSALFLLVVQIPLILVSLLGWRSYGKRSAAARDSAAKQ